MRCFAALYSRPLTGRAIRRAAGLPLALALLLAGAHAALAGPVVIGGDDLPLHGSYNGSANVQGWLYMQKALAQMYPCVTIPGNDGSIAALGVSASTASNSNGGGAIYHAATVGLGKPVTYYEGTAELTGFFSALAAGTTHPAIIWICSGLGDLYNELDPADIAVINANAGGLAAFVNAGGGLMAHTCVPGSNQWLPTVVPGMAEISDACQASGATLTAAGIAALPGVTNGDITAGPCHSSFTGALGSLSLLATEGLGRQFIIGGGCGTQFSVGACPDTAVLHVTFDDPTNRALDVSGNHLDGALGAATAVLGRCGTALRFRPNNNVQEYSIPAPASQLDITGAMTGLAWIRIRGTQSTDYNAGCTEGTIFCKGGNYWFQVERNNNKLVFQNEPSGTEVAVSDINLPINSWIQVGFVRGVMSGGSQPFTFYLNGSALPTVVRDNGVTVTGLHNPAFANPAHPFMVGNYGFGDDPGACEFNGDIDDIRVFNRALSSAQMLGAYLSCACPDSAFGPCANADSLVINTGRDQTTASDIAIGQPDNEWTVTSDPDAATNEPRPAFVIPTYLPGSAWANPTANSEWISSYPTSVDETNGHYVFDYKFCLQDAVGASVDLCMRADDRADVYMNGTHIGATVGQSFRPASACNGVVSTAGFVAGPNVLRIDVENVSNVAMGLDLVGSIHGHVPLYGYCCSDSAGRLFGTVWTDTNGNKVIDSGEPRRSGWTVRLGSGKTAVTDVLGNYYFSGLPPGTYVASLDAEPNWLQTFPPGPIVSVPGTYTQILDTGEVEGGLNFAVAVGGASSGGDGPPIRRTVLGRFAPNPMHDRSALSFDLPVPGRVDVKLYDIAGRIVADLSPGTLPAGPQSLAWDRRDSHGERVAAGLYFVRIRSGRLAGTARVLVLN